MPVYINLRVSKNVSVVLLFSVLISNSFFQWKDPEAACGVRQGKRSKANAIPEVCVSIYSVNAVCQKDELFAL